MGLPLCVLRSLSFTCAPLCIWLLHSISELATAAWRSSLITHVQRTKKLGSHVVVGVAQLPQRLVDPFDSRSEALGLRLLRSRQRPDAAQLGGDLLLLLIYLRTIVS